MSPHRTPEHRAELAELQRIAAARVIRNAATGGPVTTFTLAWARRVVATHKPLGRPLGTGEPA